MNEELKEIQQEIKQIRQILSTIVGAADRSVDNPFSEEILTKVAKDFLKLSIERGDWVIDDNIRKIIKTAPYNAGSFLRKEFAFANWYRHGHHHYYSKKDLIAFNDELVKHNIDLERYREMLEDKRSFERTMEKRGADGKLKKGAKPYVFPKGVKDITTSPPPKPDPEIVRTDLARLKEEFKQNNYAAFVDVYKGLHAMMKHDYTFWRYRKTSGAPNGGVDVRAAKKWCDDFNYANSALKEITGKKEKFVAPPDPTQIEL